jgi:uncharacterized protein GlcG (DUF336 family)
MLTLDLATAIIRETLAHAESHANSPVAVAVLDAGGHTIALARQDGAGFLRTDIAVGKAWGSMGLGFPSRGIADAARRFPEFFNALAVTSGGKLFPAAGGVLILRHGQIIGAVGVSGDSSAVDEECAIVAVTAVGLTSNPATSLAPPP